MSSACADSSTREKDRREQERLSALEELDLLDTPSEEAFDRITRLTKRIFQVPLALITIIDGHRVWPKSCDGTGGGEAPREHAFCSQTIKNTWPLVVPDATKDDRFARNPFVVGEPHVRFYAGIPLRTRGGHSVGTLCVVDFKPRGFPADQLEMLYDLARLAMDELELRLTATRDGLTGVLTRREFIAQAERATLLALRHHDELSCIALDLDHFKAINDTYGHAAGDAVLRRVTQACVEHLRVTDLLGRLGGEEFDILLPNTGLPGAVEVAERLRAAIEALRFEFDAKKVGLTASFGIASLGSATRDVKALLERADAALYLAKGAGRNRCVAAPDAAGERDASRRRVLKAGQILFNGRRSVIDCTVRTISDLGAGLDVSTSAGVPRIFELRIGGDELERACRTVAQTPTHIEAEFC